MTNSWYRVRVFAEAERPLCEWQEFSPTTESHFDSEPLSIYDIAHNALNAYRAQIDELAGVVDDPNGLVLVVEPIPSPPGQ